MTDIESEFGPYGDDGYRLELPKWSTVLTFDRLRRERGELVGELTVASNVPGIPSVDGIVHVADFNLSSARARPERGRILLERTKLDIDWTGLLDELALRVGAAERKGRPAIALRDLPRPGPDDGLEVDGLRLLRRHPAIVFGDGGDAKSYLGLY